MRGRFAQPEYITQRESQLGTHLGDTWIGPGPMTRLVHVTAEWVLLSIAYQEAIPRSHVNMSECPCVEMGKHESGIDESRKTEKRHQSDSATTYYYIRWMGDMAMY